MALADSKKKPTVSIVGAGRLGNAFALALASSGYPIQSVVARRSVRARKAARGLGHNTVGLAASQLDKVPRSELVLIATPDDAIAAVAKKLSVLQTATARGRIALHTSGALSSEALLPLQQIGFHVGSIHPLVAVTDSRAGAKSLRGAFYCLEGDVAAVRVARSVVRDLKGHSFSVQPGSKALYHAAAVMASGHVVALCDLATEMLVRCGLTRQHALRVLRPLIESTLKNMLTFDPAQALTGTFARGDLATVQKHLSGLSSKGQSEALEVYRLLGRRSLELAERNGLDSATVNRIRRELRSVGLEKHVSRDK
jgi:predicted short-subunit dehydrogenase-like oxidoreductase (DUF2520 family)